MYAYLTSPCRITRVLAALDQVPLNCSGLLVADGDDEEDDNEPVETPEPAETPAKKPKKVLLPSRLAGSWVSRQLHCLLELLLHELELVLNVQSWV